MNKSIFNDGKYDDEMLHQQLTWSTERQHFKNGTKTKDTKEKHIFRFEKLY